MDLLYIYKLRSENNVLNNIYPKEVKQTEPLFFVFELKKIRGSGEFSTRKMNEGVLK